jgi:hypothetical protein
MSSPKAALAKTSRRPKAAPAAKPVTAAGDAALTADATRLAAEVERALAQGRADVLAPQAIQALMTAACRAYSAQIEAGNQFLPVGSSSAVTSTDVMLTASGLLRAANLAVFELGMWQSWTGR